MTNEEIMEFVESKSKFHFLGDNDNIQITFEPGNGTRYDLAAFPVHECGMGCMGYVENGWLVANGLHGKAYLFQAAGYLTVDYVAEHLCRSGCSLIDATCITAALGWLIGRPTNVTSIELMQNG